MTILHLWSFFTKLDIKNITSFPLDLLTIPLKSPSCCLAENLLSVIIRPLPFQSLGPIEKKRIVWALWLLDVKGLWASLDVKGLSPAWAGVSGMCPEARGTAFRERQLRPSSLSSCTHLITWDVGSGPVPWGPSELPWTWGVVPSFSCHVCSLSAFSLW